MHLEELQQTLHPELYSRLVARNLDELRPAQEKAAHAGAYVGDNVLICTPTASGKTLVAEIAALEAILQQGKKAIYIVPLKALALEKYREFKERYDNVKIGISIGDLDEQDDRLGRFDLIFTTSEKLDSLMRSMPKWLTELGCVVIDEIHLLQDPGRGPTLEVVITLLRHVLKDVQIVGLSATIGNPEALADWLGAKLVVDTWRPVKLEQGVYYEDEITFFDKQ